MFSLTNVKELTGATLSTSNGTPYKVGSLLVRGTFCSVYACGEVTALPQTLLPQTALPLTPLPTTTEASSSSSTTPAPPVIEPSAPQTIAKVFDNHRQFRRTMLSLAAIDGSSGASSASGSGTNISSKQEARYRDHIERVTGFGSVISFDKERQTFCSVPYVIMPKYEIRLKDFLEQHVDEHEAGLPALATLAISRQLFMALDCLQAAGVVHSDIKPGNIMIRERPIFDVKSVTSFDIVLCDFGSSHIADPQTHQCAPAIVGTTGFIAPEILLGRPYSFAADVWSAMTSIFAIITGDTLLDVYNEEGLRYGVDMHSIAITEPPESTTAPSDDTKESADSDAGSFGPEGPDNAIAVDFPTMFAHIVLMYRFLGKPPEAFCAIAPEYYYNGAPRYMQAIEHGTLTQFFMMNYTNLNLNQIQQISEFLMLGLQYMESDRATAAAILAHRFLSPVAPEPMRSSGPTAPHVGPQQQRQGPQGGRKGKKRKSNV
jgi:serine/threonine protein kinase